MQNQLKILITGSNGLLGQKLVKELLQSNVQFLATSNGLNRNSNCPEDLYCSLDITNKSNVYNVVEHFDPTHIIHTAAMTNVDACELDPEVCHKINVFGTKYLFEASKKVNSHFQLLSTDFVFDGEKGNYSEDDAVNPLSVYAKSKVDAENLLLDSTYENWSIARTIIVYGTGENLSRSNLLVWAKEALPKQAEMKIVNDQFRAPTWADDLAWGCIKICKMNERGIFHLSGPETYSILEIVKKIGTYYNWSTSHVQSILSSELNQPAKRPPKTGFNLSKSRKILGYFPKTIEETLDLF